MIPGNINTDLISGADEAAYQISRSLRFNSADSAYLSRTPASAGNRKTWTWSGWVKRSIFGAAYKMIFSAGTVSTECSLRFTNSPADALEFYQYSGGVFNWQLVTTQVFRDPSAWYHIVVVVDSTQATSSDRAKLYVNGAQVTAFGTASYPTSNYDSLVNSTTEHGIGRVSASQYFDGYLADIHFIDGQALTPSSFAETNAITGQWVPKAYTGSYGTNGFRLDFSDNSAATATTLGKDSSPNGNNWTPNNLSVTNGFTVTPSVVPFDPQAAFDGNQGTYAYGPSATTWTFNPPLSAPAARLDLHARPGWTWTANTNLGVVTVSDTGLGWPTGGAYPGWYAYANAGLTTIYSISVSAGANWTIQGVQTAGNPTVVGTRLLVAGLGQNDSLVDTPTSYGIDTGAGGEVRGNYCTLNPLTSSGGTYSQGNLFFFGPTDYRRSNGTIAVSTGKWYWEVTLANGPYSPRTSSSQWNAFGFGLSSVSHSTTASSAVTDAVVLQDNGYFKNFSGAVTDVGTAFSSGDVLSCAVDLDANTFTFRRNNTQVATGTIGGTAGRELVPIIISYNIQYGAMDCNFGARSFAYQAPSGFKALCDTNLPAPVVAKPSTVMDVVLYNGNSSNQSIASLGFSPDLVWGKSRNTNYFNTLQDTVRGAGQKILYSNSTDAENAYSQSWIDSFDSNGFTMTTGFYNQSGYSYAAWCFDAGSSTVSNTQGSITSQVRANASAGFSIVTFTCPSSGAYSFGHGLGVAPSLVILKDRGTGGTLWAVYHSSVTSASQYLTLNSTAAITTTAGIWGAGITSTVVGSTANIGIVSNSPAVAYCFAPVAGYSAFGSYTGNGSADGPFVYTGFRPKFVLIKGSSFVSNWNLLDGVRDSYNVADKILRPNLSNAELNSISAGSGFAADFLSNGFKLRASLGDSNSNAETFVWAAFAESPFAYARAR